MSIRLDAFDDYKKIAPIDNPPCVIYSKIERSPYNCAPSANWHIDLELQLCIKGNGYIVIDGEKYDFKENDIFLINSHHIHCTDSDTEIVYIPLIISADFCENAGIDCSALDFETYIKSEKLKQDFKNVVEIYFSDNQISKKAKLQMAVLQLLIELCNHHIVTKKTLHCRPLVSEQVKNAIVYIRQHYAEKITLDTLAYNIFTDKYKLSHNFKALTGITIIEYINKYRCDVAKTHIRNGLSISETATLCGFNNMSFFTKTFYKHTGKHPSDYKKK